MNEVTKLILTKAESEGWEVGLPYRIRETTVHYVMDELVRRQWNRLRSETPRRVSQRWG